MSIHATTLGSKYWIILPKNNFLSNRETGAPQSTNLKEEPFLLKPNTYMNLSGKRCNTGWTRKIFRLEIMVITDDLNLSFGTIRIKPKEVITA
jgi:peptidyl-tRNA hydrolase